MRRGAYRQLVATAVAALTLSGVGATSAVGAPGAAPAWYVTSTSTSTAYDHGCETGRGHFRGLVVLFMGGPSGTSGTLLVGRNQFASLKDDAAVAGAFARGYARCLARRYTRAGYRIVLALSSNNSTGDSVGFDSGKAWGRTVNAVGRYVKRRNFDGQVRVAGGSDIEPGFGPPRPARAFVRGFTTASDAPIYNTGSADGCPQAPADGDGACNAGWHQSDIYYVSWGRQGTRAVPEIYYTVNATQWALISRLGARSSRRGKIVFSGALSEHRADPATLTADASWNALLEAVRSHPWTSQRRLAYSTALFAVGEW